MSTTVQYKGNILATVSNDTKTLKTAGKYMEGDVVLTDVSGGTGAISVVDTTDTHGGTIRTITAVDISDTTAVANDVAQGKYFYTADGTKTEGTSTGGGGDTWTWMGKNPTFVKNLINTKVYLKDSDWANWTPSTTAQTITASASVSQETLDLNGYSNIITMRFHTHFEYDSSSTGKNLINDYYFSNGYCYDSYCGNLNEMTLNEPSTTVQTVLSNNYGIFYKDSNGGNSFRKNNYGLYVSSWVVGSGSSGTNSYTISVSTPSISARCNSTYFTTANASAVNQDTSYYEMKMEIWKVAANTTTAGGAVGLIRDMWKNGF